MSSCKRDNPPSKQIVIDAFNIKPIYFDNISIIPSELNQVRTIYDTVPEESSNASVQKFMQAGCDLNVFRAASADGFRMMLWLSRYLNHGEDPLKLLIKMASDYGFDVSPEDYDWANTLDDENEKEKKGEKE